MLNIKPQAKKNCTLVLILLLICLFHSPVYSAVQGNKIKPSRKLTITKKDLYWFGKTIYYKECGGRKDRIVAWNKGENFPSFGIGHFIWYPAGNEGPFQETFPSFLAFVKKRGIQLPLWIDNMKKKDCPWKTREEFYSDIDSYKMGSLRSFLLKTMYYQSLFIVKRFKTALPKMIRSLPDVKKEHVKRQFYRVADSTKKLYALIDYVNFKGEGVKKTERYNDQGWGLLQVLQEMQGRQKGRVAMHDFSKAAETVLLRRVRNAPIERNENRWLNGWRNRVNSYITLAG